MSAPHFLPAHLLSSQFTQVAGDVLVSGQSAIELTRRFGTPLYVYDQHTIETSLAQIEASFRGFRVLYSLKANPSLAICGVLASLGVGAEIASAGEMQIAKAAGFSSIDMAFAGPAKLTSELFAAVEEGVGSINVESFGELARLQKTAHTLNKRVSVCLRVNRSAANVVSPEVMAGYSSKFGIDESVLSKGFDLAAYQNIDVVGAHVYTASQILDVQSVADNLDAALTMYENLSSTWRFSKPRLIFGGGLGVPYRPSEFAIDSVKLTSLIDGVMSKHTTISEATTLYIELGRYLVASCGVLLARVVDTKVSQGQQHVLLDTGMNQFLRPVLMRQDHPVAVVSRLGESELTRIQVGGPLCTPIDMVARDLSAPPVIEGDILGIFNTGAYGFSMSPRDFLGHPSPAEVLVTGEDAYLIRDRGDSNQLLVGQHPVLRKGTRQ